MPPYSSTRRASRRVSGRRRRQGTHRRVFGEKDYNSGNGMMTSVWGPAAWFLLHIISFNYPVHPTEDDKRNYRNYILSFGKVLPCGKCRENFKMTIKRMPVTNEVLSSRDCFSRYIYRVHNDVNARLQKKTPNPTFCEVRDQYEVYRARCGQKEQKQQEKGCTEPLKGIKSKCLIRIVPKTVRAQTLGIHPSCSCRKGNRTRRSQQQRHRQ